MSNVINELDILLAELDVIKDAMFPDANKAMKAYNHIKEYLLSKNK